MMFVPYLIIISIILISITIGYNIHRIKSNNILNKGTGKFGILIRDRYDRIVVEVEELEQAGYQTKVKVINVSIPNGTSYSKSDLMKGFIDWVETSDITWYSDNSQRVRESKLKQILG